MTLAEIEPQGEPTPLRWSTERYLALVESGVIEEGRGIELIDGQVVSSIPQGKLHYLICLALQRAFIAMGAVEHGLSIQPTIRVAEGEVYDPEFVLLRPEYAENDLPRGEDVRLVVEVSITSLRTDLTTKRAAYARAGIPEYWVVDGARRGVWVFSDPVEGAYRKEGFVSEGEVFPIPVIGTSLDTSRLFPSVKGA